MAHRTSSSAQLFFVVSYDISDNRRRKRVSDILLDFGGRRVQYSVFECRLAAREFARLRRKLHKLRKASDSIRYYFLCRRCFNRMASDEDVELRERDPDVVVIE